MVPTVDNGKLMPVIRPLPGGPKPVCRPTLLPTPPPIEIAPRLSLTRSISLGIPLRLVGGSGHSIIRPLRRTWSVEKKEGFSIELRTLPSHIIAPCKGNKQKPGLTKHSKKRFNDLQHELPQPLHSTFGSFFHTQHHPSAFLRHTLQISCLLNVIIVY